MASAYALFSGCGRLARHAPAGSCACGGRATPGPGCSRRHSSHACNNTMRTSSRVVPAGRCRATQADLRQTATRAATCTCRGGMPACAPGSAHVSRAPGIRFSPWCCAQDLPVGAWTGAAAIRSAAPAVEQARRLLAEDGLPVTRGVAGVPDLGVPAVRARVPCPVSALAPPAVPFDCTRVPYPCREAFCGCVLIAILPVQKLEAVHGVVRRRTQPQPAESRARDAGGRGPGVLLVRR